MPSPLDALTQAFGLPKGYLDAMYPMSLWQTAPPILDRTPAQPSPTGSPAPMPQSGPNPFAQQLPPNPEEAIAQQQLGTAVGQMPQMSQMAGMGGMGGMPGMPQMPGMPPMPQMPQMGGMGGGMPMGMGGPPPMGMPSQMMPMGGGGMPQMGGGNQFGPQGFTPNPWVMAMMGSQMPMPAQFTRRPSRGR